MATKHSICYGLSLLLFVEYHYITIVLVHVQGTNTAELQRVKRQNFFGSVKPEGATCLFDPCVNIANYCRNSGTCFLNDTTCMSQCFCAPEYTGQRCDYLLSPITESQESITPNLSSPSTTTSSGVDIKTTSERQITQQNCTIGYTCEHGSCDNTSVKCICDYGWTGDLCENPICPFPCPLDLQCAFINMQYYCVKRVTETTSTESSDITLTDPPNAIDDTDLLMDHEEENVCSANYTLHPLQERQCVPNFICLYGACRKTEFGTAFTFACDCDEGAIGVLCDSKCCLNCSYGICSKNSKGEDYCRCYPGYTGINCESETTMAPPTSLVTVADITPAPTGNYHENHTCSANYTLRTLDERKCITNFVCGYGICRKYKVNNKQHLECVCDDGGTGDLCQDKCCLQCSQHGKCNKYLNGTEYCFCEYDYEGELCDRKIITPDPIEDTWYLWVVGVCAGVLGILILALVIIPYWMWHNRVTLIMKIVHYFQPYEDDDDRTWDAFVSYKSTDFDQNFVLHTLFPKLEKELGFTLCMHFRDFMPGETIANNIINAVNNSRRTIMILTPRYVQSEFTRFEYQVAQHEMLKRKHRIIPILLEDISKAKSTMDPNLRQIISSVTYLQYPGQDATEKKINTFWKRLVLSMPKKRSTEESRKQLENNNKTNDSNGVISVISKDDDSKDSTRKSETEMTSISNGQITPTDSNDVSVEIMETVKEAEEMEKEKNGELNNKYNSMVEKYMSIMENSL